MVSPFHTEGSGTSIISSVNGCPLCSSSSVGSRPFQEVWWVWGFGWVDGPGGMALNWLVVGWGVRDCSSCSGLPIFCNKFSFYLFSKSISSSCRHRSSSCQRRSSSFFCWSTHFSATTPPSVLGELGLGPFVLLLSGHGWRCSLLTPLLFVLCCWKLCCLDPTMGANCTCEGPKQYLCLLVSGWCVCNLSSISFLYCWRSIGWGVPCDYTSTIKSCSVSSLL